MSDASDVKALVRAMREAGEDEDTELTRLRAENERLEKALAAAQVESEGRLALNRQVCDEIDKLRAAIERKDNLLRVARCPNKCDGGVIRIGPDDVEQCQWCYERDSALGNVTELEQCGQRWQPLETAPKDGTRILLVKIVGHPDHDTALWWASMGCWSEKWQRWWDGIEPSGLAGPTHWMPVNGHGIAISLIERDSALGNAGD